METGTGENEGLTGVELDNLADLLTRVLKTQIRGSVWHALIQKFPTVPIELIVLDWKNRVLLVHRDDEEFPDCWHHPGSVWNAWETIPERRKKLVNGEILRDVGITITEPMPIGWLGVYQGVDLVGARSNPSRTECSLIHLARFEGVFNPKGGVGFFSLDGLPKNTLQHHKYILSRVQDYLATGQYIFD
jgi:hypothetical protein